MTMANDIDAPAATLRFDAPRFLEEKGTAIVVETGYVDLFWVERRGAEPQGRRRHVHRIDAGGVLFDTPAVEDAAGAPHALLAVPGLGCISQVMSRSEFFRRPQAAMALERWIIGLARRGFPPVESLHVILARPPQVLDVGAEAVLNAAPRTVAWLAPADGTFLSRDGDRYGHGEFVPVTEDAVALTLSRGAVACLDTAAATLGFSEAVQRAIDRFNAVAVKRLARRFAEDDRTVVLGRIERNRAAEEALAADFSNLAAATGSARADAAASAPVVSDASAAVFALALAASGITAPLPPPADATQHPFERLAQIANAAHIRSRRVVLRDLWWQGEHGPLIGFRGDTGRPVALLPTPRGHYRVHEAGDATGTPLDAAIDRELAREALTLYPPLPASGSGLGGLAAYCWTRIRREALAIFLASAAVSLIALLTPLATDLIFGTVVPDAAAHTLLEIIGGLVVAALGGALFQAVRAFALVRVEGRLDWAIQAGIIDRMLDLPASFFKAYTSGDLADRLLGIEAMRQALTATSVTALLAIVFSMVNLVVLVAISLKLAALAGAFIAVGLAVTTVLGFLETRRQAERVARAGKIRGLLAQFVGGIAKLRIAARGDRAIGVWARELAAETRQAAAARRNETRLQIVADLIPVVTLAAIFVGIVVFGQAKGSAADRLSLGDFLAFNAALGQLLAAMTSLAATLPQALGAIPLYERARPIFTAVMEGRAAGATPPRLRGEVKVERVTFRYQRNEPTVIDDLSFAASPGEFVAIVGSTGSGKSTLLRLLLGFETPEAGTILFDGRPIESLDMAALRREMGVVLQNGRLSPGSIYENIVGTSGLGIDDAWEAARLVGLDRDITAMPMGMHTALIGGTQALSGGQRQRLLIARALVRRPRLLLLDEATSALDNVTQATVMASLARLNVTRIVVAHRLSTIKSADRIVVMQRGRLAESGSYAELMAQDGVFALLARRQLV
jgi:ATP-binding cassette subfamily C protein